MLVSESATVMHPCPHCGAATFSELQKLLTLWIRPRACAACHKAAFLPVRHFIHAFIVWSVLAWVFIGITWYMKNVIFLFGTIPSGFFALDWCIRKAPLQQFFVD